MSGLVGVFMRSGAPADRGVVAAMAATTPHRAADGAWAILDGSFSAVRQITIGSPEDAAERGPVQDSTRHTTIVFDGRLDNRDDLADQLCLRTERGGVLPDASLALAAWNAWGEHAPARLLGDFAFVVWNAQTREVFCARDPMGVRPFFYFLSDNAFVFASEPRQLLVHPLVPHAPDEVMIADLLAIRLRTSWRTLYRDIRRLPHGHWLAVTPDTSRITRYWTIDYGRELTLRDDDEYAEAFRDVFDRAVSVRTRTAGPLGAYLSGGLDSSSILVSAVRISDTIREKLTAFSLVFPGRPEADERAYSEPVARRAGVPGVQIAPPPLDPAEVRGQIAARRDLPDFPNDETGNAVRRAMAERGIRVALTGSAGDYGLSGSYFQYADFLRAGRLVAFARRYRDITRDPQMSWHAAKLLPAAVWPLLPLPVRRLLRPVARRASVAVPPAWIHPDLARRAGLHELEPIKRVTPGQLARVDVGNTYDNGWAHMALDMYQRGSTEWLIEDRHPFLDRRVVEFVLALPDEQRWQKGVTKYVLRRAMHDRLPPEVRDRSDASKGEFSHLFFEALQAFGGEQFFARPLLVADNGWVVAPAAQALFSKMRERYEARDIAYADMAWQLWTIAALELWCREVYA